jgi:phage FluMu protein Com
LIELQKVKCVSCGKLLLEAIGEVKKICPKCKAVTHVVVTSKGIINLSQKEKFGLGIPSKDGSMKIFSGD